MESIALRLLETLGRTLLDVLPILLVVFLFQALVIRRSIPNLKRLVASIALVVAGLVFFLEGLELALFPLGALMAEQLTNPSFLGIAAEGLDAAVRWQDYWPVFCFAAAMGFSTTIAEPALIAVAIKARDVSGGTIGVLSLRMAVALGVALGITLGVFRIITGTPLHFYIIAGYVVLMAQTWFAPRSVVALAYDSGGVTTSTVTVPLVAALGLGLAGTVPGRDPVLDGFGLIAFASLFPIMAVLGYAQIAEWRRKRQQELKRDNR